MNKQYVTDMTRGNEIKLLVQFTIPMLLGNLFQQFYNLADTIIVGQFGGPYGLPSIGAVGSVNFLFFSLCLGMGAGVGIMISQNFGAGKDEYVKKIVGNAITITLVAGILMSVISVVFARPILTVMDTPKECMEDALLYMRIVCGATFLVAGYNMISSILRALGDSKHPVLFLIIASVVNILLDLLFIIPLQMGITGAALATVISQFLSGVMCLLVRGNSSMSWLRASMSSLSSTLMGLLPERWNESTSMS